MRIDAYNQLGQLYQTQRTNRAQKAYNSNVSFNGKDQLMISQTGQDYQVAKQAVAAASDIREDMIAQIKEKVANGSYNVDTEDFASKLLQKYNAII